MNVVVLTGAGISAESGLKTFRDNNGLWENHRVEEVATPEAFEANPDLVYRFYNQRRLQLKEPKVKPNSGHQALVRFEQHLQEKFLLVTQNVDDLHERAGSQRVLHMHGELKKVRCVQTGRVYEEADKIDGQSMCACCKTTHRLRPHIVWFGEQPFHMDEIFSALGRCSHFISIGTSAVVYPAAIFVKVAKEAGAKTIEINLDDTPHSDYFDVKIRGKAGLEVPKFIDEYFA